MAAAASSRPVTHAYTKRRSSCSTIKRTSMKPSHGLLAALLLLLSAASAGAEDYPSRQIRLIVPFPAGGPSDIIARVLGQRMSEITKQPVIIDNRGDRKSVV